MATAASLHRCEFILLDESSGIFAERFTDIYQINDQILQLDNHIQCLYKLRSTLVLRSNQLRSPSYALPFEVLSRIFQETVPSANPPYGYYEECCTILRQSFVFSLVSNLFCQVALGTPRLWERIGFEFTEASLHNFTPLFEHCASYACPRVLSLRFYPGFISSDDDIRPIINTLFSPDITRKIHTLDLGPLPSWLSLPPVSLTFPVLDAVKLHLSGIRSLDLEALPLTRVALWGDMAGSVSLPPSVRYLEVGKTPRVCFPHECPNLVECFIGAELLFDKDLLHPSLCHLWRLTCRVPLFSCITFDGYQVPRMPSLEYLKIEICTSVIHEEMSTFVLQLSRGVSSTLIFLILHGLTDAHATFRQLFGLPMPNLEHLNIFPYHVENLIGAVQALTPGKEEYKDPVLPSLNFLGLESQYIRSDLPAMILDMLKKMEFGLARDFHLSIPFDREESSGQNWSPELREGLRSIVNSHHLIVTQGKKEIGWL